MVTWGKQSVHCAVHTLLSPDFLPRRLFHFSTLKIPVYSRSEYPVYFHLPIFRPFVSWSNNDYRRPEGHISCAQTVSSVTSVNIGILACGGWEDFSRRCNSDFLTRRKFEACYLALTTIMIYLSFSSLKAACATPHLWSTVPSRQHSLSSFRPCMALGALHDRCVRISVTWT